MRPVLTKGCGNQMHHQDQHTFQQATATSLFMVNNTCIVYGDPYTVMERVCRVQVWMNVSKKHEKKLYSLFK